MARRGGGGLMKIFRAGAFVALSGALALIGLSGSADAATITITSVANNTTCVTANGDNGNDAEAAYNTAAAACSEPTGGADSNFMRVSDSGATASSASPGSSTSIDFDIDAGVAADSATDFSDEYEQGKVRYALGVDVTALVVENWTVDLAQDVLGLFGFAGDGTLTAVGTQVDGNAGVTTINVDVDTSDFSFSASPSAAADNPSNNAESSVQFSGSRSDSGVASGSGNASFTVTISFDIDAFSNTGCSGFICSSASGGEDAAVLMGYDNVDDCCGGTIDGIRADNYSQWARAVGPDGYNSTLTLNVTSDCGNSVIDAGEGCDQGAANGAADSCCTNLCQLRTSGDICRAQADTCDVGEVCDGVSPTCPVDSVESALVVCRAGSSGDLCDIDEFCDGVSVACPADMIEPAGTVCRSATGACDVAEQCDGLAVTCPSDTVAAAGVECRAVGGVCDQAENCDGASKNCPADGFVSGGECRAAAGVCDVAESCDGSAANCPPDGFDSAAECRAAAGVCDVAESCNGGGPNCPSDGFDSGTQCRVSAGVCDVAEACDGSGANCPADGFDSGTICRASTGDCDAVEICDGSGASCPVDGNEPDGTTCDDGMAGTILDQCLTGMCAGTPLSGNLDAFKCYKSRDLKNPKFLKTNVASLDDEFQNETNALIKKPFLDCNPADVDGAGIFNAADHLVCYKVQSQNLSPRPKIEVTNVFGTVQLEARKSYVVCFPSSATVLP